MGQAIIKAFIMDVLNYYLLEFSKNGILSRSPEKALAKVVAFFMSDPGFIPLLGI